MSFADITMLIHLPIFLFLVVYSVPRILWSVPSATMWNSFKSSTNTISNDINMKINLWSTIRAYIFALFLYRMQIIAGAIGVHVTNGVNNIEREAYVWASKILVILISNIIAAVARCKLIAALVAFFADIIYFLFRVFNRVKTILLFPFTSTYVLFCFVTEEPYGDRVVYTKLPSILEVSSSLMGQYRRGKSMFHFFAMIDR